MIPDFLNIVDTINEKIAKNICGLTGNVNGLCFETKNNDTGEIIFVDKNLNPVSLDSDSDVFVFHVLNNGGYAKKESTGVKNQYLRQVSISALVQINDSALFANIEDAFLNSKIELKMIEFNSYKAIRSLWGQNTTIEPQPEKLLFLLSYTVNTFTIENCIKKCS